MKDGKGMRTSAVKSRFIQGAVGAVCLLLVFAQALWVRSDGWKRSAGRSPSGESEGVAPFARVDLNPFALYESEIGRTLSGVAVLRSDATEHMGIPRLNSVDYQSLIGVWIDQLWRAGIPGVHVHASDGVVDPIKQNGEFKPGAAQLAAARQKVRASVENAYRLDPGNPQAFSILAWTRMELAALDELRSLEEMALYSMKVLRRGVEIWPEHSLSLGSFDTDIWHIHGRPMAGHVEQLSRRLKEYISQADATKAKLEKEGVWALRSNGAKEWYDQTRHFLSRFVEMADDHLANEKANKQ